ncbi:MAG: NADH-quinone oxidoreductase subunit L, partial [Planctomycetota bacterium]
MTMLSMPLGALSNLVAAADGPYIATGEAPQWVALIPALPLLGAVLCLICACLNVKNKAPGYLTVGLLAGSFVTTLVAFLGGTENYGVATIFRWIHASIGADSGTSLVSNFAFYFDGLSMLWMLFVTGLATVIGLYSSEYMSGDKGLGYCRFFFAFNVFVFSMSCLVMADNLLLLFLGWEGVGLCSYLLIGYYYKKPEAVAAAKKAFIVNRIGDLGLLMAIGATFVVFGTVELRPLFEMIAEGVDASGEAIGGTWAVVVIPLLLTAGAFGKSAQLFFYVWLPDAMEGPTPVSALIHAATMVTAGVYLIARMFPLYAADDAMIALTVVAWAGAITAFWAATIEFAQYDIKRIMGYSTISQLGFMFAGLGLLGTTGAVFHVFTHAFFKATLFLCCGAVMHGFGGQLSLRRLSGVMWMKGFGITAVCMLIGCLSLSGVPFTAGYFSKDMILAQAFAT